MLAPLVPRPSQLRDDRTGPTRTNELRTLVCPRTAAPFPASTVSPPHRPAYIVHYAATQCVVSVRCNAPPDRQGSSPFPGRGGVLGVQVDGEVAPVQLARHGQRPNHAANRARGSSLKLPSVMYQQHAQPATAWLSEDCGSRGPALSPSSYPWMRKRRLAIGRDRQPAGALQSGVEWPWPNRPLVN